MEKIDARKLSREALFKRRQQVIRLQQEGKPVMEIVKESGLSWPAVNVAIKRHKNNSALEPARRGKKQGTGRILSEEQESRLCNIIYKKRPWQVGFRTLSRKLSLWNRDVVMQLIEQECGIKLSVRCVAKYLERWGFPLMKQRQRPKDRCTREIKKWLDKHYNEIENRAKAENAIIYWLSKKTVLNDTERQSHRLSMISAISNQGKEHWLVIKGVFSQERQINFLKALANDQGKLIILIRNNFDHYTEQPILDWIRENKKKIESSPRPFREEMPKQVVKWSGLG